MLNKYNFLFFIFFLFYTVKSVYAHNDNNTNIAFKKFEYDALYFAKVNVKSLVSTNSIDGLSEFSEFGDLDDKDIYQKEIYDPFEKLNRQFLYFSLWLDKNILPPVEKVYFYVIPKPVRIGFVNFFCNANEPISIVNHLLQFKLISGAKSILRFSINTTLGFFGFIDVASTLNLQSIPNDFGYTLTYYHIGEGFYIFVPLVGPYTLKNGLASLTTSFIYSDVFVRFVDINYLYSNALTLGYNGTYYLENRKSFLTLISSSSDVYSLVKSAYLQNRTFNFNKLKNSW